MSEPTPGPADAPLQFEQAEYEEGTQAAATTCAACRRALTGAYYEVGGRTVCERCQTTLRWDHAHGSGIGRFMRALVLGSGAALAGGLIYYAIRAVSGYEFGLVAVVIGFMVGRAVRAGSRGRGGWRYQALAMFLTYTSIVSTYIPEIAKAVATPPAQPGAEEAAGLGLAFVTLVLAFVFIVGWAFVVPFLGGFDNIIGLVIIGIGLYEAWKLNQRTELKIEGPYRLGSRAPGA